MDDRRERVLNPDRPIFIGRCGDDDDSGLPRRFGRLISVCSEEATWEFAQLISTDHAKAAQHTGWMRPLYVADLTCNSLLDELQGLLTKSPEVKQNLLIVNASYPILRPLMAAGVPCAGRTSDEETPIGAWPNLWVDRWNWNEPASLVRCWSVCSEVRDILVPGSHYTPDKHWHRSRAFAVSPETRVGPSLLAWLQGYWREWFRFGIDGIYTDLPEECERCYKAWEEEKTSNANA